MTSSQPVDGPPGDQEGFWRLCRSTLINNVLCGVGLGLWEAVTVTEANRLLPIGGGHFVLFLAASAFYASIAMCSSFFTSVAVTRLTLHRGVAIAAGPWVLLTICSVSAYRRWALSNARSLLGTLITLGIVLLAALILALVVRRDKSRPGAARRFSRALSLAALALGSLSLVTLCILGARQDPEVETGITETTVERRETGVRVLLIGLDGVPWKVVESLTREGRLPVLSSLIERGVTADLETILPTFSPIIWTSIATGKAADKHGVFDHTRTRMPFGLPPSPVALQRLETATKASRLAVRWAGRLMKPANVSYLSGDIRSLELWDICDAENLPAITLSWYISYPVCSDNGIQVSDHLARGKESSNPDPGLATPAVLPGLLSQVVDPNVEDQDLLLDLIDTSGLNEAAISAFRDEHAEWFRSAWRPMARDLSTLGFARQVFPELPDWRLASVFYKSVDGIHHISWKHMGLPDSELDRYPERRFRNAVEKLYEFSDTLVGETLNLIRDRPELETVVIIVSDHGWDDETLAHDLAPDGIFLISGGPTLISDARTRLHIYDVAPTILALLGLPVPRDMDGRVATELIDPKFWNEYPIQYISTYESGRAHRLEEVEIELDDDDLKELKALGYIE